MMTGKNSRPPAFLLKVCVHGKPLDEECMACAMMFRIEERKGAEIVRLRARVQELERTGRKMTGKSNVGQTSDMWRVDVCGVVCNVRGRDVMSHLERVNRQLARMKMALHQISGAEPTVASEMLRYIAEKALAYRE